MCFIPWILVVMWTATFANKTMTDECNAENYKCSAPVKGSLGFSETTPPTTPSQTSSSLGQDEKNARDALATSPTKEAFISGSTDLDATKCDIPERISTPKVNSAATFKGMKIMSIISIVVMLVSAPILFMTKIYNQSGGSGVDYIRIQRNMVWAIILINTILGIMISVFLGENNKLYTSAGFHTSIIAILLILICLVKFLTPDSWPMPAVVINVVLGILCVLMIFGTIFIHTFQKRNIEEGKYTHAVNESISAIVPPVMIVYVIGSILVGVGSIATKNSLPFGITQIISAILLLDCISMYYKYKNDCKNSIPICENKIVVKQLDNKTKKAISICQPETGMSITKKTIINMGIAISVLMGINHLAGGLALGLHEKTP